MNLVHHNSAFPASQMLMTADKDQLEPGNVRPGETIQQVRKRECSSKKTMESPTPTRNGQARLLQHLWADTGGPPGSLGLLADSLAPESEKPYPEGVRLSMTGQENDIFLWPPFLYTGIVSHTPANVHIAHTHTHASAV